jgi:hypothetical protein
MKVLCSLPNFFPKELLTNTITLGGRISTEDFVGDIAFKYYKYFINISSNSTTIL